MFALLAALIMQFAFAPADEPTAPAAAATQPPDPATAATQPPEPGASTPPNGPDRSDVRRGPATAPRMIRGEATIRNSGSTNAAGYTIVIAADLGVVVTVGATTERKTIAVPQGRWLFAKLREAMPLAELSTGRCMKSTSFGSSTTISYDGHTSPDISCGGDALVRELNRTVGVIVEQLGIEPSRRRIIREP